jgi:hypothetical protein
MSRNGCSNFNCFTVSMTARGHVFIEQLGLGSPGVSFIGGRLPGSRHRPAVLSVSSLAGVK